MIEIMGHFDVSVPMQPRLVMEPVSDFKRYWVAEMSCNSIETSFPIYFIRPSQRRNEGV